MAEKKKKDERKVVLERVYVVPLRKEWLKAPNWRRTKKAVSALKDFAAKHMKAETVRLGKYINKELWKHGIQNPPHKVKVNCSKDDKGMVTVELVGAPVEKPKEEKKKKTEEKKEGEAKKEEKAEKKKEAKTEEKAEVKKGEEKIKKALSKLDKETEALKKKKEVKEEKPAEKRPEVKKEEPKEPVKQ